MSSIPRLNGIIKALENDQVAICSFASPDISTAIAMSTAPYDGIVFEAEHNPWDIASLRDSLQYLLNRKQIATSGSLEPNVTPIVRIPVNGMEMSQVFAKQALDTGFYGIVWPHIDNVAQAMNAVGACRYARPADSDRFQPKGIRGDGPTRAVRYWGLSQQEYYDRADVWPLDPEGEIFVILMIEGVEGVKNLPDILENVKGIGAVLIGEGDLSQELGHPRDYEHPIVREAMMSIVANCKNAGVPVGHPHVSEHNVEKVLEDGFRFMLVAPERSYRGVEKAKSLSGRS